MKGLIFFVCLLILGFITDAIEGGASLTMLWWSIPVVLVMLATGKILKEE